MSVEMESGARRIGFGVRVPFDRRYVRVELWGCGRIIIGEGSMWVKDLGVR